MEAVTQDELRELRASVRALLDKESPELAVREAMGDPLGYDPDLWRTIVKLGLPGLAVPEGLAGAGAGWAAQGVVLEELGNHLTGGPYLATVGLAVPTLLACANPDAVDGWLPDILNGRTTATAAIGAPDVEPRVSATPDGAGWRLTGSARHVLDGAVAGVCFVPADTPDGPAVFVVARNESGFEAEAPATSDRLRRFAHLRLSGVTGHLVARPGEGERVVRDVRIAVALALACEQVGGAERALGLAVEYARRRVQFGRPIGCFQAVQHRCADMLVATQSARSAAWAAVRAIESDAADAPRAVAVASAVCGEAYRRCASDCVQMHGGIGYTWEHPAHLHVKRSRGTAPLVGSPREVRARLVDLLPDPADGPCGRAASSSAAAEVFRQEVRDWLARARGRPGCGTTAPPRAPRTWRRAGLGSGPWPTPGTPACTGPATGAAATPRWPSRRRSRRRRRRPGRRASSTSSGRTWSGRR